MGLHENFELVILFLDCAVRYGKVLVAMVDDGKKAMLVGRVYECVGRGVASGGRRIRSRCCYLLLRFVKAMGGQGGGDIICKALNMVLGKLGGVALG